MIHDALEQANHVRVVRTICLDALQSALGIPADFGRGIGEVATAVGGAREVCGEVGRVGQGTRLIDNALEEVNDVRVVRAIVPDAPHSGLSIPADVGWVTGEVATTVSGTCEVRGKVGGVGERLGEGRTRLIDNALEEVNNGRVVRAISPDASQSTLGIPADFGRRTGEVATTVSGAFDVRGEVGGAVRRPL